MAAFFRRDGALEPRRDWAPMLDLLYAAANNGTGRRAALAIPTFGKTGTSQDNRDALFVGFAGNLIVGVWVGRDDNNSLGKVSGGTVPAEIWRSFMTSALAVDGRHGPPLPYRFGPVEQRERDDGVEKPASARVERWHQAIAQARPGVGKTLRASAETILDES